MIDKNFVTKWQAECEMSIRAIKTIVQPELLPACAERQVIELLGVAHRLSGIACTPCHGCGVRTYTNTGTWRTKDREGMIVGHAFTKDVCDSCWGTGRTDVTGPDLRAIDQEERWLRGVIANAQTALVNVQKKYPENKRKLRQAIRRALMFLRKVDDPRPKEVKVTPSAVVKKLAQSHPIVGIIDEVERKR